MVKKVEESGGDFEDIENDYEDLEEPKSSYGGDSIFDIVAGAFEAIPLKLAIFVMLLFLFISSDIFIDWGLSYIPGAVEHRAPTNKGIILQSTFLTLGFILMSILIDKEVF